jgi:hypothetical protein
MASVVNISATKRTAQTQESPFSDDPFFRRFFGEEFERRFKQPRERQEIIMLWNKLMNSWCCWGTNENFQPN